MSWPIPEIRRQQRPASLKFWRWALWFLSALKEQN
ncbi:Uncharacterised protein [Pragia fontium]|nr:Uncharacterised protein [Pragia fontium]